MSQDGAGQCQRRSNDIRHPRRALPLAFRPRKGQQIPHDDSDALGLLDNAARIVGGRIVRR